MFHKLLQFALLHQFFFFKISISPPMLRFVLRAVNICSWILSRQNKQIIKKKVVFFCNLERSFSFVYVSCCSVCKARTVQVLDQFLSRYPSEGAQKLKKKSQKQQLDTVSRSPGNRLQSCLWRHKIHKFCRFPRILWRHKQLWTRLPGDRLIVSRCNLRLFFVIFWALSDVSR